MDFLSSLLGRNGFLPHGYCFTWTPALLWSMVGADAIIAASYFSIPIALMTFIRRRGDVMLGWVVWLFSAFIFACGTTHVMDIWTVWQPDYGLQSLSKMVTAGVSVVTAIALWPLIPAALKIPSVQALQEVIARLESEVRARRSAEDNLADVQESLAITLAAIGAGFIATDAQGRVTRMNPVAQRLTGRSLDEARGLALGKIWRCEGDAQEAMAGDPVAALTDPRAVLSTVHRLRSISQAGEHTAIEAQSAPILDADGSVRGMALVLRDMTQIERGETAMRELAAIVESSNDAIVGTDLEGRVTSWNHAAMQMFGYGAEEAIGRPITILHAHGLPGQFGAANTSADVPLERKDGSALHASITVSPMADAHGRPMGFSSIMRDVSLARQHEAMRLEAVRLEADNHQIQEANRIKSEFLANMSHELRTPLNAVIGFTEILLSGAVPAGSNRQAEYLGHVRDSGRHLLKLINDVLDLSKVESGKLEFAPETVDIAGVVQEVANILRGEATRKAIALTSEVGEGLAQVVIDPSRLKQVLYNFLSNAIKFTPEGGRVTVTARAEGEAHFRIEVQDTGIGMTQDQLGRLFERFQQLHSGLAKPHPGTGLGLALTRRLVELQGGSVGVRSRLGAGSVFHAILPRTAQSAEESGAALPQPAAHAPGTPVILVVEDEPLDQARMAQALGMIGFAVEFAATVDQARRRVRSERFDAITLDLILPDGSGLQVLEALRDSEPNAGVPVLVLTVVAERSAVAGFAVADVLAKPIRQEELRTALHRIGLLRSGHSTVLVIDDDPGALDLMAATLRSLDIEAHCARSANEGLDALGRMHPDAIILDLLMPERDGFSLLAELRQNPQWNDTPIFVWTSLELTRTEIDALSQSAQAVIDKGQGGLHGLLAALRRWQIAGRTPAPGGQR